MRQLQVRLFLGVYLLTTCWPVTVAAEEAPSAEPPMAAESDQADTDPESDAPELPLSGQAAAAEPPTEPAYGIEPPVPLLPDPTDPTLSADLADQNLVNLFQGAAEFRVPLALPPGVNGHALAVELRYSSHQVRHNGPFGFGWQLELGTIRRVTRGPAVTLYDEDEFFVSLPDLQGELVLLATDGTTETYGLRREQNFARIERELASNSWQVTLKDGRRYTLGSTAASRLQSEDGTLVSEWHVEVFEDTFGNQVEYAYDRHDGALYPKAIQYGGQSGNTHPFTVAFEPFATGSVGPANRPDRRIDYSAGFPVTTEHLVDQIRILVEGTERLRYDLAYTSDALNSRSDLSSVTVTGSTGQTTTSQELGFNYYPSNSDTAGPRGNLLRQVQLPTGGVIEYDYQPSTQLRDNNELLNHRPPVPLRVVTAMTRSDFTGRQDTTTYQYRDGHFYFDAEVRGQVAGFGRVSLLDPLGQRTEHYFHQGGGFDGASLGETVDDWFLMGRPYRVERYDAAGTLRERQITQWESSLLGDGRSFIRPVEEVTSRFGSAGPDRSSATSKVYDPATGNVLEVIEHGEVATNDNGMFSDVGTDGRRRTTTYAENLQAHILALPATDSLYAHDGTLVSQTDYRYDDLPVGQVDKGARTHEIAYLLEESRTIATRRTYNPAGQLTRIIDPRSHEWTITYDALGIHPSSVENPLEHVTQYEIDPLTGNTLRETDPNGLVTENAFDGLGRKLLVEQSHPNFSGALQPVERVTYDDQSRPAVIVTETFLSPTTVSRQAAYEDGFGRTLQTRRQAAGNQRYAVTNKAYDPLGRVSEEPLAVFGDGAAYNAADTSPYKTTTEYDLFDRVVEVTDANGTTTTVYEAWSETVEDANGHEKSFRHDAFGRLAEVVEHIDGADHTTRYAHDERDQLVAITDAVGHERGFTYDSLGRLTHAEDLHDPADATFGAMEYSYDDAGNLVSSTDAAGRDTSTTYDALNRPLVKTFTAPASATQTVTLTYDQGIHGKGQLTGAQTDETGWEAVHDIRGRIVHEAAVVAGQEYAKEYAYNYFGEVALASYPNSLLVDNRYNEVGELDRVLVNGQDMVSDLEYSPASLVEHIEYGNGAVSEFTHDPARMNRLTAKQTTVAGTQLQDLTYDYDPVGNIEQLVESAPSAANRTGNYQYDEVNRLTQVDVSAGSGSYQRSYAYDPAGNIASSFLGQYQYTAAHLVNPHAVTRIDHPDGGRSQFSYDESGRLEYFLETGSGHSTNHNHAWDTRALLVESTAVDRVGSIERQSTTAHTYDHTNRRVRKQSVSRECDVVGPGSSHSVECGPDVLTEKLYPFADFEVDGNGLARLHVFADDLHVATVERDACTGSDHPNCPVEIYFHHDDHLGGASVVTNQGGAVVQLLDYYPFGSARIDEQTTTYDSTQDFTGHERDDATGLHYAQARYYGSPYGRFISQDPLQWRPEELHERFARNPQGLNFYSYALNNPLVLTDPTGEFACGGACLALLFGAVGVFFTSHVEPAVAPDLTTNQTALPTQSPSLLEGFGQNVDQNLRDRDLDNAATALKVGITAAAAYRAARTLQPVRQGLTRLLTTSADEIGEAASTVRIRNYSRHALDRAMGNRGDGGVKPSAILDALRDPQKAFRQANGLYKFSSEDACIVFDNCGKVITTWPLSNRGRRLPF